MLSFKSAPQDILIVDEEGNPILAGDENRRYFEGDCSLSEGVDHKRSVKFTELKYNEDGTIQTIDPYNS